MSDYNNQEQSRFIISIAVVASAIGLFGIDSHGPLSDLPRAFVVFPGILFGFYILFTAAHLKYKRPSDMGELAIPERMRRWAFDTGVNMFWYLFITSVLFSAALLSGWPGDLKNILHFWPSLLVAFILLLISVFVSASVREREVNPKPKVKNKKDIQKNASGK